MTTNTRKLVDANIGNDFGLTVDTIAQKCKSYGRFDAWLNQDVTKIKRVLLAVKAVGISPAFFASYERSEGYNSQWGWLNHTTQQGDYFNDATSVANVVLNQSRNMSGSPSWIDYGNPVDFVPQQVKNEGNQHFTSLASGTIGRALIPLTAAATWATYYPQGLLKEYNQVQNYADPIKVIADSIIEWGGTLDGGTVTPPESPIDIEELFNEVKKVISEMLNQDVFQAGTSKFYSNAYIQLMNQLENTYKVKLNKPFFDLLEETFTNFEGDFIPDPTPDPDPDPDNNPVLPMDTSQLWITQEFGGSHRGIDLGVSGNPINTRNVYSVMSGTVSGAFTGCANTNSQGCNGGAGNYVVIEHDDGYSTRYLHLGNVLNVRLGERVSKGQVIGKMANSGTSTGSHLHFEVCTSIPYNRDNVINPKNYVTRLSTIPNI